MNPSSLRITLLIAAFVIQHSSFVIAQGGPLTPPGAPAPTMKTLDQIEPRIAINATNTPGAAINMFVITAPGSYYLSGNITGVSGKNGISINADNVTLDLNGFSMTGVAGSLTGITLAGTMTNIVIRNGTVASWGGSGINGSARNSQFHQLQTRSNSLYGLFVGIAARVTDCGAFGNTGHGIAAEQGSVITHCTALSNGGDGIVNINTVGMTVIGCTASNNGGTGIVVSANCLLVDCIANANGGSGIFSGGSGDTLTNCIANQNTGGFGINVSTGSTLSQCTAFLNTGDGISAGTGSTLTNCTAKGNSGTNGIITGEGSTLIGCTAYSNNVEFGIFVDLRSTLTNCTASGNTSAGTASWGISAGAQCTISNCTASGNLNTNVTPTGSTGGGILAGGSSTVQNCTVVGNKGDGIQIASDSRVVGNNCDSNEFGGGNAAGIHSTGADNRIEGNNVTDNTRGIDVDSSGSLIIKNSASGSTGVNYEIAANNRYGPIVDISATGAAAVSGSTATDTSTTTHPWANFSF